MLVLGTFEDGSSEIPRDPNSSKTLGRCRSGFIEKHVPARPTENGGALATERFSMDRFQPTGHSATKNHPRFQFE
jgi:hypothetical protein